MIYMTITLKTVMACTHQLPRFHQWVVLQESLYHPSLTLHKHIRVNYHLKDLGQVQIPIPPSHLQVIYQGSMNQQDKQQPCIGKLFQSFHEPIMMTNVQPYQTHTFSDQSHFVHRSQSTLHTDKFYFKTVKSIRTLETKTKMFILTISFSHDH